MKFDSPGLSLKVIFASHVYFVFAIIFFSTTILFYPWHGFVFVLEDMLGLKETKVTAPVALPRWLVKLITHFLSCFVFAQFLWKLSPLPIFHLKGHTYEFSSSNSRLSAALPFPFYV